MTDSPDRPEAFDAIIVGAGQAGPTLARELAAAGRRVAIVEREHVGGTCINEGCTPTKTMVASARVAHVARHAAGFGVDAGEVRVDLARVRQRKRDIVDSWREGGEQRLRGTDGVELILGEARFTGPRTFEVSLTGGGTRRLTAEQVFLNTGARPVVPDVPGLRGLGPLTSTTVMELGEVPRHLLIVGGSYIAVEFGQMFRRFGAEVTLVERAAHLLAREDEDVSSALEDVLRDEGVELCLNARLAEAGRDGEDVWLRLEDGRELRGSHVLVAAGRAPNTEALNLPAAGVEIDGHGFVRANERLETTAPGVWALGDVKGGPAFTHISYDDYRIVAGNLLRGAHRTTADRPVPYTVFTDPQLGRVGVSEREARERGLDVKVAKMPMEHVARALELGETRGFMKAIVDAGTDRLLGVAILGLEGGELMSALQIAMMGDLPYTALRDGVFAHPTLAEAFNNLFAGLE